MLRFHCLPLIPKLLSTSSLLIACDRVCCLCFRPSTIQPGKLPKKSVNELLLERLVLIICSFLPFIPAPRVSLSDQNKPPFWETSCGLHLTLKLLLAHKTSSRLESCGGASMCCNRSVDWLASCFLTRDRN